MTLNDAVTLVVTALLVPFIVALFSSPKMSPGMKRGIAVIISGLVGFLVAVATNSLDVPDVYVNFTRRAIISIGVVTALAQGYYKLFKTATDAVEAKWGYKDDVSPPTLSLG